MGQKLFFSAILLPNGGKVHDNDNDFALFPFFQISGFTERGDLSEFLVALPMIMLIMKIRAKSC
jgi:hypothetical protein